MGKGRIRRGFTLLELVVVVAVLAVLAGLVLPKLDLFSFRANEGVAAVSMTDVSRVIQQYRAQSSLYPDRWDSLLKADGTLWVPGAPQTGAAGAGLIPVLVGGPPAASNTKLTTTTLNANEARSLSRMGITTLLDLDAASTDVPGSRFTISRSVVDTAVVATVNPADGRGKLIISHFYPIQADAANPVVPTGSKLVVVGLGPRNTSVGSTLQETPFYSNTDHTQYYDRYLALFEAHANGSRAVLVGVVGADGDLLTDAVKDFYER